MTFTKEKDKVSQHHNLSEANLDSAHYIASCDVGTTTIRCFIYKTAPVLSICASATEKICLVTPKPGHVEIDPKILWEKFITVIKKAIEISGVPASRVKCLGLSTQRSTFILWDRISGEAFHNFITWKDMRADSLVSHCNNMWKVKASKIGTSLLYFVTRSKRFLAASIITFQNVQVSIRLKWMLENNKTVQDAWKKGNLMFGTIDTWLVYQLTGKKVYATDHSNASGTAIYDPFIRDWSQYLFKMIHLPPDIYPEIRDTSCYWGECVPELFGSSIPITAVVSDQGAALMGGCGFKRGDAKATLGTGAFLDINTGKHPHASLKGIYPCIGWKDNRGTVYMAEGSSNDNGTVIEWGQKMGFYADASETSGLASSVEDTDGVFFIPGFQGIQAPVNDTRATGGFIGLTMNTRREHVVRAMLESLAFRIFLIYQTMNVETSYELRQLRSHVIRVDGGVAKNDFLMQMLATLTDDAIERPRNVEASALGCCFLAGLGAEIWRDYSELEPLREIEKVFNPIKKDRPKIMEQFYRWQRALKRFGKWHTKKELKKGSPT